MTGFRRVQEVTAAAGIEAQIAKLRRGMGRLIDGYAEGLIDKADFEPRVAGLRQRIKGVESRTGAVAWAIRRHPVSRPRSSNAACGFPALRSPTGFTAMPTTWPMIARV